MIAISSFANVLVVPRSVSLSVAFSPCRRSSHHISMLNALHLPQSFWHHGTKYYRSTYSVPMIGMERPTFCVGTPTSARLSKRCSTGQYGTELNRTAPNCLTIIAKGAKMYTGPSKNVSCLPFWALGVWTGPRHMAALLHIARSSPGKDNHSFRSVPGLHHSLSEGSELQEGKH